LDKVHIDAQWRHRWKLKAKVIELLGGKCVVCHSRDLRILTINHKKGHGKKETDLSGGRGQVFYRQILRGERSKEDLEVRCFNHNIIYDYEQGLKRCPFPIS
jgi:hypothetical protein